MRLLKRHAHGFTLIEIILSVSLIAIVGLGIGPMLVNALNSYKLINTRRAMLTESRQAMDRIIYELRLIPNTNAITSFSSSSIQFNILGESNILYALNGTTLQRSGINFADNISNLTFSYFDNAGNITSTKANIWQIRVSVVVSKAGSGTLTFRSTVFPRQFTSVYGGFK